MDKAAQGDEMPQQGRPLSELRGRTEEANALAEWLRQITAGITVRTLAEKFHCSTTSWSGYRSGSVLIPEKLLDEVVISLVRAPDTCARQRDKGRRLLKAAQEAGRRKVGQQKAEASASPHKTLVLPAEFADVVLRLDDARLRQFEAERKLADSEQRCARLKKMVSQLQAQHVHLTEELKRTRLEAQDARKLQAALEQTETNREQAEAHLRHARKANEQAFELSLAAEASVVRAQVEVGTTIGTVTGTDHLLPQPTDVGLEILPAEYIGEALQTMGDELEEQDEGLDELRSSLGLADSDVEDTAAPSVIVGQVIGRQNARPGDDEIVREDNANNADNPVTSTDSTSPAEPIALVPALSAASSPADLGRAIEVLRERSGVGWWPLDRMASKANAALRKDESRYTESSISGWLDGTRFPKQLWSLKALVEAMDAIHEERAAFSAAYLRIAVKESQAFKEAYPRITRQADESFEGASLRAAQEEERAAREQAARALAAREKAGRDKEAEQERKARREAEAARLQKARQSAVGHQAGRLITEAKQVSDVKGLVRLLEQLQSRTSVSTEDLARSVFASTHDRYVTTMEEWLSGTALPTDHHFTLLVRALLVSPNEEAALLRALRNVRNLHAPSAAAVPPAQTPEPIPTPPVREEAEDEREASRAAEVVRRRDARRVRRRNAARFIRKADRVIGPRGLSRSLHRLSIDAKLSTTELTRSVLGSAEDEHITTVGSWMSGKVLPAKPLFTLLVRALLAWPDEEAALLRAYDRVQAAEKAGAAPRPEPGLGTIWVVTRLGACLIIATLWAVFHACVKADPGPHGSVMFFYFCGAFNLSGGCLIEMVWSSQHTERTAIVSFSWLGPPIAVLSGCVLPLFPALELWGRWPAELVGLL
ncbi:hypothetical protein ACFV5J_26500 [Streptomyces zaomyceticus]|uniref:hypothetical protein n=1 Tax=Streptomyces zaomyceticus TaxID=68286 RepID=UPI0036651C07